MMSGYIINVTEADFKYEVISYSQNTLVLVDFWAPWCRPCKTLSPLLEILAVEAQGGFRLARLDVEENPNLALKFNVRSIPTVKAFSEGKVTSEFVGILPEPRLREFISHLAPPSPLTLVLEKADSYLANHQWAAAEKIYRELLDQDPRHPASLLGLAKSRLAQDDAHEAIYILADFPASPQYGDAQLLKPLADIQVAISEDSFPDDSDHDATFTNCIRLAGRANFPAALDGMLDILRQDRHYRDDIARHSILAILEIMGPDDPLTRQYRSELASVLF